MASSQCPDLAADSRCRPRPRAGARSARGALAERARGAGHPRRQHPALSWLRRTRRRHAVRRIARLDRRAQGLLRTRRGRHLGGPDRADHVHQRARDRRIMGSDRQARVAVHGRHARPRGHADRRLRGDRCAAVLRVLRSHADPDVHHHRHLGRPATRLCHAEVLHLHLLRLDLHAGRPDLPAHEDRRILAGRHSPPRRSLPPSRPGCSSPS